MLNVGSRVIDRVDRYRGRASRPHGEGRVTYVYPSPRFIRVMWDDGTTTERIVEHVELIKTAESAPVLAAPQNTAERDPAVTPDCTGADTPCVVDISRCPTLRSLTTPQGGK